jgi:hypothetical protein
MELAWANRHSGPTTAAGHGQVLLAMRALGVRNLAEAALLVARPSVRLRRAIAAVDAGHAVSMITVALARQRHRRVCVASAAVAVALALVTDPATCREFQCR